MIQYTDNTFSEIMDTKDLFKQTDPFLGLVPPNWRSIHFGTKEELEDIKTTEQRLSAVEAEVENMKPIKTSLHIPNKDEISLYGK